MSNSIPVIFLTYNRLEYSKKTLEALLKTTIPIEIYVWDNASTDGTKEWLKTTISKYDNVRIVFSPINMGLNKPINYFIKENKESEFIAKIDNDTVVEPNWLEKLLAVMKNKPELDALGAYMQRPPGDAGSFEQWKNSSFMRREPYGNNEELAYCAYCGGSGVLIRMRMFKEMGLLWEGYKSVQGDLTCMFRLRSKNGTLNNIAWYSGTIVKLLNIKIDGVELSSDYPEYDEEIKKYRDAGNDWYMANGGPAGIQKLIEASGGRERI